VLKQDLREQHENELRRALEGAESRNRDKVRELEAAVRRELNSAQAEARKVQQEASEIERKSHQEEMNQVRGDAQRTLDAMKRELD